MGTWTDVAAQRMFLIGSCIVSWFLDELRLRGAGLFLTIEGTGENHPGWQEDSHVAPVQFHFVSPQVWAEDLTSFIVFLAND